MFIFEIGTNHLAIWYVLHLVEIAAGVILIYVHQLDNNKEAGQSLYFGTIIVRALFPLAHTISSIANYSYNDRNQLGGWFGVCGLGSRSNSTVDWGKQQGSWGKGRSIARVGHELRHCIK
jgi:hypothetical protein